MPPFKIAPWELPPDCDAPLVAPADFVFRSLWGFGVRSSPRETEIWVRTVAYKNAFLHFLCDGERPQNGNWILSNVGTHYPFADFILKQETLETWFQEDNDLWFDNIMRLVYFDGTQHGFPRMHRATVRVSGDCRIQSSLSTQDSKKRVMLESPFKTEEVPTRASTMRNQLLSALSDEDSEAHFAFKWLHLRPNQQKKKLLRLERETLEPMQRLLRAVLQSQVGIWEHNRSLSWKTCNYEEKSCRHIKPQIEILFVLHPNPRGSGMMEIPPRILRWKWAIWNHFIPALQNRHLFFALCARGWPDVGTVEVEADPPTHHEQIEALLFLRDWWNQHFPPELFDAHNRDDEAG